MSKQNNKKTTPNTVAATAAVTTDWLPTWLKDFNLLVAIIAIVSFACYANTLFHDYTQDDAIVIYDNMYTQQGVSGISGILGKDTFFGFFKEEGKAGLVTGGRYRPFTLIMFAIENQIFGSPMKNADGALVVNKEGKQLLEYSKFWGHFFNVFWYAITCIALFVTLRRLLKNQVESVTLVVSFFATLLFAVHPIHTEAVANIKGRDEIMALLGSITTLYCLLKMVDTKKIFWLPLAALSFFIALMSKENAVAFLGITPLAFYFFRNESIGTIISKVFLPLFGAFVLFMIVRTQAIGWQFGGTPPMELMNNPYLKLENGQYVLFSSGEKFAAIFYTLGKYIQLLFAPITLTHDYYPKQIDVTSFGNPLALLSLLAYFALAYLGFKSLKTKNIVGFGILFFLASLFIVSNIPFAIGTNMSERFMFMPSVGFCLVLAYLIYHFTKNITVTTAVLGIVAAFFIVRTVVRNNTWKDNATLFFTDVETSPNSAKLQNAVGGELITQSLKETDVKKQAAMQQKATTHLEKAIKIHPTYRNAYLLLGNAHNYLKNYDKSIKAYEDALKLDPMYGEAKANLAVTYREVGKVEGEKNGNLPKALQYLEKAYAYNNKDAETLRLLGVANGIGGNTQKALEWFIKCIELNPNNAHGWWDLGTAYGAAGNAAKASEARAKALSIDPNVEKNINTPK
jgi:protein O-mannosyl-transferase